MMRMTNDISTDEGRGSLRDRLPPVEPPTELAARVKATLERRGLVRRRNPWVARLGYMAAGILLGFAIRGALGTSSGCPPAAPTAGQYVLLLYGNPEVARSCPHLKYGGRVVVMAVAG